MVVLVEAIALERDAYGTEHFGDFSLARTDAGLGDGAAFSFPRALGEGVFAEGLVEVKVA